YKDKLEGLSSSTAVEIGLTRWMAALNDQQRTAREVRRQVRESVSGLRQTQGRLTDLVGRLAPRAGEFKVIR
ncbi:hypothetical protein, partial [Stenotrophomonas maltophilia]|uniref:hypothetical protein n=1 Tax=Stenotrophomonas maltophilia TaxID=40324 RepID=UPI001954B2ED